VKIYIENQVLEYKNDKNEMDNILNEIDNIVSKSSKILSHMVIDDFEVYEGYYDYFLDNIRVIEKVEVISLTYKELVDDILISTMDYIGRIPFKIEELSNSFYKNPDRQAWNNLNDLLGGISWIMNSFTSIDQDSRLKDVISSYENWNLYAKEVFALKDILPDLEGSLSSGDNITIADILSYEILPIFNEMEVKLLDLVKMEGSFR
jgi:hypothetical protein